MFVAYIALSILAAAANLFSATLDFIRYEPILISMDKANVPRSWLTMLGILKAAGALGLLIGIGVPLIGTAAAVGLILFFVAAIITHLRARDYSFGLAVGFLLLAVAPLVLGLYVRGPVAFALVAR
jgi:DoxX-like family